MQVKRKAGRPRGPERRGDQIRVTIWLPRERGRLLKACARFRGEELGAVIDRGIDAALGGFYVAHRLPFRSAGRAADRRAGCTTAKLAAHGTAGREIITHNRPSN